MPQRLLFDPPARMVHRSDLPTSVGAAIRLVPRPRATAHPLSGSGGASYTRRASWSGQGCIGTHAVRR